MLSQALAQIDLWEKEAIALDREKRNALSRQFAAKGGLTEWNRRYYLAARDFYRADGSPDSKLERNMWAGSSGILPGLAGAVEKKNEARMKQEVSLYLTALKKRVVTLRKLRADLKTLR
jgi:hypothetical protein